MAWLTDVSLTLRWLEAGHPEAEIAYSINATPEERAGWAKEWREGSWIAVRAGEDPHIEIALSPRPPDADRIIARIPAPAVPVTASSPPIIKRSVTYTFPEDVVATIAPQEWERLYVWVAVSPLVGGDEKYGEVVIEAPFQAVHVENVEVAEAGHVQVPNVEVVQVQNADVQHVEVPVSPDEKLIEPEPPSPG